MEKTEKVFAKGFIFKRNENAPTFVIGNLSLNSKDAAEFIAANSKNGWVNSMYCTLQLTHIAYFVLS